MEYKKYHTRICFDEGMLHISEKTSSFCVNGAGWKLNLEPDVFKRRDLGYEEWELVISTSNFDRANYVNRLLFYGKSLLHGDFGAFGIRNAELVIPSDESELNYYEETRDMNLERLKYGQIKGGPYIDAAEIAGKASRNNRLSYALAKYHQSLYVTCIEAIELHPTLHYELVKIFKFQDQHVWNANSINLAYSVIEELGLEVKSSASRPRFENKRWNPKVKKDLESRLVKAGVDLNKKINWHIRGYKKTKIEKKIGEDKAYKLQYMSTDWTGGYVRDKYINIIDAIHYVSWLRNYNTAHALSSEASSITIYDVANAQMLARRLLLTKLGYWNN